MTMEGDHESTKIETTPHRLLAQELLVAGDTTGDYWKLKGLYESTPEILDIKALEQKFPKEKRDEKIPSWFGPERMAFLSSPAVLEKMGKELGINGTVNPPDIYPIKAGSFEYVFVAVFNGKPAVLTIPQADSFHFTYKRDVFAQNQQALQRASETVPGVTPRVYCVNERFGEQCSLLELVSDQEEMNINAQHTAEDLADDWEERTPVMQFLTRNVLIELTNRTLQTMSQKDKELFAAYAVAKLCAARTLMTLSTLEAGEENQPVHALVSESCCFSAGDMMGRINKKRQLEAKAIAFGGGTKQITSIDALINGILEQRDLAYPVEDVQGQSRYNRKGIQVPQIPHFPGRKEWVTSITSWIIKNVYEAKKAAGDQRYVAALESFLSRSKDLTMEAIEAASSPFTIESLQSIAPHFGSDIISPGKKKTASLLADTKLYPHLLEDIEQNWKQLIDDD